MRKTKTQKLQLKKVFEEKFSGHTVALQNKDGKFFGFSYFNEDEDEEDYSNFVGAEFAELRAKQAFLRHKIKEYKIRLNTVQNLVKDFRYKHEEVPRPLKLKLRDYSHAIEDFENLHAYINDYIAEKDKKRHEFLKRTKKNNS